MLQPDGKILVAGYTQASEDVAVARLNADGSLDAGVRDRRARRPWTSASPRSATRSRSQPNGRIVVAGQKTGGDDFAVARLLG